MADGAELPVPDHAGPIAAPVSARVVSAGVQDALERFSDPALLAAGLVNLLSVEAVEARFGARWATRQDQVYDFTARVLERGLGEHGFFVRVSPTDYFIVQPELGRVGGQASCLRYLREILTHFLGDAEMAATGVLQVTKITGQGLEATAVDKTAHAHTPGDVEPAETVAKPPAAGELSEHPLDRWTPFVAADGRRLRVSATLQPVYELKGFTRIGFRMVRRVLVVGTDEELSPQQVAQLPTADILRVDLATVVRGVDRLKSDTAEEQLSLIVPLSFTSLSSIKGRAEFVKQLKVAGALVRLGVICEICDIDGAPPGALLAAGSLLRPFTLLVVGRLMNTAPAAIVRLEGAGLQALSFECPGNLGDAEFSGWASAAIGAAKRVTKSVLVYGASPKRAGALASLGASHVSLVGD